MDAAIGARLEVVAWALDLSLLKISGFASEADGEVAEPDKFGGGSCCGVEEDEYAIAWTCAWCCA